MCCGVIGWTWPDLAGGLHYREAVFSDPGPVSGEPAPSAPQMQRAGEPLLLVQRAGERFVTQVEGITTHHAFSFGAALRSRQHRFRDAAGPQRRAPARAVAGSTTTHTETSRSSPGCCPGRCCTRTPRVRPGSSTRDWRSASARDPGVVHAERNDAYRIDSTRPRVPVRFVQSWVRPDSSGVVPSYAQQEIAPSALAG